MNGFHNTMLLLIKDELVKDNGSWHSNPVKER